LKVPAAQPRPLLVAATAVIRTVMLSTIAEEAGSG